MKLAFIMATGLLLGSADSTLAQSTTVPSTTHNEHSSKAPRLMGDQKTYGELRKKIKYIVFLMMENRSFDHLSGFWDFRDDIDNLVGKEFCNTYINSNWTVYNEPYDICTGPYAQEVPLHDPDHGFAGTSYEIYQTMHPTKDDKPTMGGFVQREADLYNSTPGDASFVIKSLRNEETSTMSFIAENFAFWDTYYAEHPGPTNPNRQFGTAGTTCGQIDNTFQAAEVGSKLPPVNCSVSLFEAIDRKGISWKNYCESDISDAFMYQYVQENAKDKIVHATEFYKDLEEGTLPQFSYYNPECCDCTSMHPLSNPAMGQSMIRHMYNALRRSKYWDETLIVINFDEHGGFYDHVPPPVDVPIPEDGLSFNGVTEKQNVTYAFDRLGIRVPAYILGPYVPRNRLIHNDGTSYFDNSAYTHTSFMHFIQNLWDLKGFNNRVQWAKTFEHVLLKEPRDDTPMELPRPFWFGSSGYLEPPVCPGLNKPFPGEKGDHML